MSGAFAGLISDVELQSFEAHTVFGPFLQGNFHVATSGSQPIPEPGTLLLLGTGLAGFAGYGIRFRRKKQR